VVWKAFIGTGFANIWSLIIIDSWVFFDVDNGKVPITIAILGNKRLA
jgi:hypothetical protein